MISKLLYSGEVKIDQLPLAAIQIKQALLDHINQVDRPFVLWLMGGLSAGKTTFTRALLQSFGLEEKVPVLSPTFTYLNEYKIHGKWYAHMDLYRASDGFDPEEMGLIDHREFAGFFIEWPSRLPKQLSLLAPTHLLDIQSVPSQSFTRKLELTRHC